LDLVAVVWRLQRIRLQTSKQTYGGRMAVVSGCSLVAPPNRRMEVAPGDVWRSYLVADRLHLFGGCTRSKQTYGGRIWLHLFGGCNLKRENDRAKILAGRIWLQIYVFIYI